MDGERLGRLTVLGLLGTTGDALKRRRLFYGLDRVWRSVNGDNDSGSPYRERLRSRSLEWGADFYAYESGWQQRYLGDSAPLAENQRAEYFGVAMDACWALFEARVQRDPSLDPNALWADLTSRYLRVVPHPELSWWAMRGQLISVPGYLVNYALGAFIAADVRARITALHGDFALGDTTWYGFARERIYRFGLERSSLGVMEDLLGRPLSADALLADLRRR